MMTSNDLESRGQRSNLTCAQDSQSMISYKLFSHSKPLGPMIRQILVLYIEDMTWWPFCFQHKAKITLSQAFLPIYIMCTSDEVSFRTHK